MLYLDFKVRKQFIDYTGREFVVAKSRNLYTARFTFDETWQGVKFAIFKLHSEVYTAQLENDECVIPWEFFDTEENADGYVSVFCGNLITANSAQVKIYKSGYEEGKTPQEPTPTVWENLTEKAESAEQKAEEARQIADTLRQDAESGKFDGKDGEDGYSPAISLADVTDGVRITVHNKDGEETAEVRNGTNGRDGIDGQDGQNGADGYSPSVHLTETETGVEISVQNKEGTETAFVRNGTGGDISEDALSKFAVKDTAEGERVNIPDSAEFKMQGMNIFGKSTQVKTTGAQFIDVKHPDEMNRPNATIVTATEDGYDVTIEFTLTQEDIDNIKNTGNKLHCNAIFYLRKELVAGRAITTQYDSIERNYTGENVVATVYYVKRDGQAVHGLGVLSDSTKKNKTPVFPENLEDYTDSQNAIVVRLHVFEGISADDQKNLTPGVYRATIKGFMVSLGETNIPWESYTDGKPSPSPEYPQPITSAGDKGNVVITVADGAERSQSVILSTPNGLHGIPVKSGGNYTDASGQRWVADSIEYRDGKVYHVQRVWNKTFKGNDISFAYSDKGFSASNILPFTSERREYLCTQASMKTALYGDYMLWIGVNNPTVYFISTGFEDAENPTNGLIAYREHLDQNPVTVMTYLDDPIETEITGEEADALKALYTYDGTTVVENDENCHLQTAYVADTKRYIEKRLAELNTTIAKTQAQII